MSLIRLEYRPGIWRDVTPHEGEGGWWDCDKVRFRLGKPEVIGGWEKYTSSAMLGSIRTLISWGSLSGSRYVGAGTTYKYYIVYGGVPYDVTPIRRTTSAGAVTFAAASGSNVITVSDTGHGAGVGDYVTFSGAVSLGGNITATVLNAEHAITSITGANTYTVTMPVTANSSDTGNGGSGVVGAYQIYIGSDTSLGGAGWGAGGWGSGGWGSASSSSTAGGYIRFWSHDRFGEDLVINPRNGGLYYWDQTSGVSARAVDISAMSGAVVAPTVASRVMVSGRDRHLIAFGCDDEFSIGTQDPLLIRWADQESILDWQTKTTNTAGSLRVSSGTRIVTAVKTKREIIVFTETSLHSMRYVGPPYTFGIDDLSSSITIIGPEAAIAVNDVVFWMGYGKFMMYDGRVREIDCPVRDYVFRNMASSDLERIVAGHNAEFSEVWWFYPDSSDEWRYVVYNYTDGLWYFGYMDRTAWLGPGIVSDPLAASTDGYLYAHERGRADGSTNPSSAISAHIESMPIDLGEGDMFFFANRIIPDISFLSSTGSPSVTVTVSARDFPGAGYDVNDSGSVSRTASSPVEKFTNKVDIRLRGRSFTFKVSSSDTDTTWRLGVPRIDVREDGRR